MRFFHALSVSKAMSSETCLRSETFVTKLALERCFAGMLRKILKFEVRYKIFKEFLCRLLLIVCVDVNHYYGETFLRNRCTFFGVFHGAVSGPRTTVFSWIFRKWCNRLGCSYDLNRYGIPGLIFE